MLGAVLIGVLLALMPAVAGASGTTGTVATQPAVDSPSPTLGSTESPPPNPPGARDADPNDWAGATWVVAAAGAVVILIVAGSFLWLRGRRGGPGPTG